MWGGFLKVMKSMQAALGWDYLLEFRTQILLMAWKTNHISFSSWSPLEIPRVCSSNRWIIHFTQYTLQHLTKAAARIPSLGKLIWASLQLWFYNVEQFYDPPDEVLPSCSDLLERYFKFKILLRIFLEENTRRLSCLLNSHTWLKEITFDNKFNPLLTNVIYH